MENLRQAKDEMKRADHLIFVSLKYTRTVDMIKTAIERLIAVIECGMNSLLTKAKKEKKIKEIPDSPKAKADLLKETYPELAPYSDFYLGLRKISKAEFKKTQEYRRHVTMTTKLNEEEIEITIDIITDYYNKTKEFIELTEEIITK